MASTSRQSLSHSAYTVACICPMGVELAPVLAMLDHIHESLPTERDSSAYTLGEIGKHNVVVAVLPETGSNAAATAATQLLNDFRSIRFGLLVGTGGGVPGEEEDSDIRLGDVVVSQPIAKFGGVVQYDLGKRLVRGEFERSGQLNKPPAVLSSNVRKLEAQHLMSGSQIPVYVADMVRRFPKMQARYSFPTAEPDHLFIASYTHQPGATCRKCDSSQTVPRSERLNKEPQVHYGTIGSANLVVEDPEVRDALRIDMNILCVEMEAAGLMDTFPCLVIRGICDYADSHKNERWQPYAAAVAAAYMKELLTIIPTQQVLQTLRAEEITFVGYRTHELLSEGIQLQRQTIEVYREQSKRSELRYESKRERKCHQAFKTSPYEQYKNHYPDRAVGTCRWVLDHDQYQAWRQSNHSNLLWISADPGCGKSVLSKSLVDHEFNDADQESVCYFFFQDNERQDNISTALCAILHQLFDHQPSLLRHALPAWDKNNDKIGQEIGEMWRIFFAATADPTARPVVCILDALDECRDEDRRQLITKLCEFYQLSSHPRSGAKLKFLVTSRPYDSVQHWFEQTTSRLPQIRLRGEDENDRIHDEINLVIDQQIHNLANEFRLPIRDRETLRQRLRRMEHRTYLWLYLSLEEIRKTYRDSLFTEDFQIETLPTSVEEAYERILGKIQEKQKSKARKILMIIVGARRPLTIGEMALALDAARAQELHQSAVDTVDQMRLENQIRELCGLFVFINHSQLFLIHQTAKEFLVTQGSILNPLTGRWKLSLSQTEVESNMASLCVTYLYFSRQDSKLSGDQEISTKFSLIQWQESKEHYKFFEYCAKHWTSHLQDDDVKKDKDLLNKVLCLYATDGNKFRTWFPIMWRTSSLSPSIPKVQAQHVISMSDHALVLEEMFYKSKFELEARDSTDRTALHWATERGHYGVVNWLIQSGAKVNAPRGRYGNALQAASEGGHEKIVQMLLDKGAEANAQGGWYGNALQAASEGGHEKIVQMLLDKGAEVNTQGGECGNALQAASEGGYEKIVQILLNKGARVNAQGGVCGNALQAASEGGHEKVVQMLLDKGAEVYAQGGVYSNALHAASWGGNEKVVQILLNKGAEVNAQGGMYGNALQAASEGGHEKIVQMLLDKGAEVNAQGGVCGNALHAASEGGHEKIVQMLLDKGAEVNAQGGDYGNALQATSRGGHEKIVQMLFDKGAEVNAQGGWYSNALQAASEGGREKIVQMLLDKGARVNAQGGEYGNALQAASWGGNEKIVQMLLDKGAEVNAQGGMYGNALHAASEGGHERVVQMLLKQGAKDL